MFTWRGDKGRCACGGVCTCGVGDDPKADHADDCKICASPGKHPFRELVRHGLDDATKDVDRVADWWTRFPANNIGIATGAVSGIVVVDVDGAEGDATLEALEAEHGRLPDTLLAFTGGNGFHWVFRHPGVKVRNSAKTKLGPGLDVRGDGGYIVVAPSLHRSGQSYSWANDAPLADLPGWLLERLREPERVERPPIPAASARRVSGDGSAYGLEALAKELEALRAAGAAGAGGRNHALNTAAFSCGQLVAGGELAEHLVVSELMTTALAIGLTATEIGDGVNKGTLASGLRVGMASPRAAPERAVPAAPAPNGSRGAARPVEDAAAPPEGPPPADEDDPGPQDEPDVEFELTDLGNARRLVARYGKRFRWVPQWATWLAWDGTRWRKDVTGDVHRAAKAVVERIFGEALHHSEERRKSYRSWALKSQGAERLAAMVRVASTEPGMPIEPHELDADPWLLTCLNGTIDLRTGELGQHRPEHLMTKLAPVRYDPEATLELWDRFLAESTEDNPEMISFLQRAAGYSLTGDTGEEKLFFLHGPSASGKSTFLDAMEAVLGEYAMTADFETFLVRQDSGGARSDVARLAGARLVASIEVDDGKRLAEGLVKSLTGGDRITARYLYGNEFEFRPAFKLWLAANAAPAVHHSDEAMWRRILRIPFEHAVPREQRDPAVKAALRDADVAGPAILAWAVRGCLDWLEHGLGVPESVEVSTQGYRDEQDPLRDFLEDSCVVGEAVSVEGSEFYRAYGEWAKEAGYKRPFTRRAFADMLKERGFVQSRRRYGGRVCRLWEGVALGSSEEESAPESLFEGSGTAAQSEAESPGVTQPALDCVTPESPGQEPENRGRDPVTQGSHPSHDGRAGEKLYEESITAALPRGVDSSVDVEIVPDGWTWPVDRKTPLGICVHCEIPCLTIDPAGVLRHPGCTGPGF